ncbi:MAG: PAS domain S-box protein, partial [Burkholderiales bacterium]
MRARVLSWLYLLPPALLALGALGSYLAWEIAQGTSQRAARAAFEADVGQIVASIERQSARQEQMLRALASVVATQDTLSNDTTRSLIRDIAGADTLKGVRTIGYIALDGEQARLVLAVGVATEVGTAVNLRATEASPAESLRLAATPRLARFVRERGAERAFLLRLDGAERTEETAPTSVIGLGVSRSKPGVGPRSNDLRGFVFLTTQPARIIEGALAGSGRVAKIAVRASDGVRAQMPLFADRGADDPNPMRMRATRTVRLAERDATLAASAAPNAYPQYSPNGLLIALPFTLGFLVASTAMIFMVLLQWKVRAAELRTPSFEERDLLLARLEAMIGATAEALLAVDSAGLVVAANPAAENLFRLSPEQIRTKKLIDLLPDSSIERLQSAMDNGQSSNDGAVRRARLHGVAMRRGARVPVELNLGLVAAKSDMIVCLIRDVSEHQRVEEEMRLYKRAIASSSNAIVISDVTMADHPILYINPAFERMTGYDLADSFGRNSRFMQGPDTDKTAVAKMRAAIERGLDAQVTLKNYTKEGEAFWNHITLAPVRDRNSKVTH